MHAYMLTALACGVSRYSVAGMNMFGTVAHGEFITVHANFESFPSSMLLMSRMITGADTPRLLTCYDYKSCDI